MTVNFSDILVIDTLAKGEVTRIFKSVWRRREGDRVVACKSCVVGGRVGEKDLRDLKEEVRKMGTEKRKPKLTQRS